MQSVDTIDMENINNNTFDANNGSQDLENSQSKTRSTRKHKSKTMLGRQPSAIQHRDELHAEKMMVKEIKHIKTKFWITFTTALFTFLLLLIHWIVADL